MSRLAWCALLSLTLPSCVTTEEAVPAGTCVFRPVTNFVTETRGVDDHVSTGEARGLKLELAGANREAAPDVWDGPLTVHREGGKCEVPAEEVSILARLFVSADARFLLLETYSGSNTSLVFLDARTCAVTESLSLYTGGIDYAGNELTAASGCECADTEATDCMCSSAQKWTLDENCKPKLNEGLSRQLTREQVGVEFLGSARVKRPNTREAALLPAR